MNTQHVAAIVESCCENETTRRLTRLLDFLGISWHVFKDLSELETACLAGPLRDKHFSVVGSISGIAGLIQTPSGIAREAGGNLRSLFCFVSEDVTRCSEVLQTLTGSMSARLRPLQGPVAEVEVTKSCPDLTGPMHGVRTIARARLSNHVFVIEDRASISGIIEAEGGLCFFEIECQGLRTFVSCSAELPELEKPLRGRYYDVNEDFLSTVPIVIYLKWAFRDSCWQTGELAACLIIDDPVLKTNYGFCDFRQLDRQTQEHSFSINISVIPWNWRRTSADMAALIRRSRGRFSISVHGCDHTGSEFGTSLLPALRGKVSLAKERMERHQERSGLSHDMLMVFPQGAFSRESLAVLQEHQFLAAVNTELRPANSEEESLTIEEVWSVALLRYGSFPLFTRRYPAHHLANFAFDLLLGKPCLIVQHHEFFKNEGQEVISFVKALNSLNCNLRWRSLGDVIRKSYQWRLGPDGVIKVKMFANELLLTNDGDEERNYQIQKADEGSVGVKEVLLAGRSVEWKTGVHSILFNCRIPARTELLIEIHYHPGQESGKIEHGPGIMVKVAARRYLCEFRDNVLSRHEILTLMARKMKKFGMRS